MTQNTIGKLPEFTTDEPSELGQEEVKEAAPVAEEEKDTPAELPAEEKPVEIIHDGTDDLKNAVQGLEEERAKLLREIQALRGQRREIKQEELLKVEKEIDDLNDLAPEDVSVVERILRSKGYVTKTEANQMFYESVKQEELDKFLVKYPEYRPENDPNNLNWDALQRELGYYRMPGDPHQISEILERAHRATAKPVSDRGVTANKRKVEIASVGSAGGNAQRSSSSKSLDPDKVEALRRGGWSEEEIKKIEERL